MAGKDLAPLIVTVALASCSFIFWIILLAGIGSFQSWLDDSGATDVGVLMSYNWWTAWFVLPLLIAAIAAAVMKHPAVMLRPLAILFAVAFTKLTRVTDVAYKTQEGSAWPDKADSRLGTIMAGGIMLAISTLAMTIWLAVLDARGAGPASTATGKDGAAPGHAAPGPPAGGYVSNLPAQAPAGAAGYNYGTPGVVNYSPQNNAAYAASPGAPPQGVPVGAPAPMQPVAQPAEAMQSPPDGYQPPGVPGADVAVPVAAAPNVSASHDGTPVAYVQPAAQ